MNPQAIFSGESFLQTSFSEAHFAIADWAKKLISADSDLDDFFNSCQKAGPNACAFYESTSSKVSQRLNNLLASVRNQPVVIHSNSTFGIIDEATVRSVILDALASPYPGYALLASALAALEQGDGSQVFQLFGGPTLDQCSADSTDNNFLLDTEVAIICGDATGVRGSSAADLIQYYQSNVGISSFLNEILWNRAVCT